MAMRGEEAAAMSPKQWPDLLAIGLRQRKITEFLAAKEPELPFPMRRRKRFQTRPQIKEEHQPMSLPFITVLADDSCEMKCSRFDSQPEFFPRLAAGAGIR